jgi:hypothetical protein
MKITVLYTFDHNPTKPFALSMLEASIITVKAELGNNANIYIYSTMPEKLGDLNYLGVNITKYNSQEFNHILKSSFDNSLKHFNCIGHSRIYLIPFLLKKLQQPVLYMDNDTGIVVSKGKDIMNIIENSTIPIGYCIETWMPLDKLLRLYSKISLNGPICFNNKVLKLTDYIINNGLLLYPNTEASYNFANEQINVYNYLQNTFHSHFNDMLSFTMMWHNTPHITTFINPDKLHYVKSQTPPPVIHYYYYKDNFPIIMTLISTFIENYRKNKRIIYSQSNLKSIPQKVHWLTNLFSNYQFKDFNEFPTILQALE